MPSITDTQIEDLAFASGQTSDQVAATVSSVSKIGGGVGDAAIELMQLLAAYIATHRGV